MIYVQESLVPEEKIIFGGYFHWMYTASAASWIVVGLIMSIGILYGGVMLEYKTMPPLEYISDVLWDIHPIIRIAALLCFLFGILKFGMMMAIKATTEIAVTNKRLIFKRGIIARHVDEISIDRVEGVIVEQGVLGRLLEYGRVVVRGMGVGSIVLPDMIINPVNFRKAIEKARDYKEASRP